MYPYSLLSWPGGGGGKHMSPPPPPTHSPTVPLLSLLRSQLFFLILPTAVLPIPVMAGCFPRGVPQGEGPYFLPPHHDYADPLLDQPNDWGSEPEEDDGFVEVLEVDEYPCVDRPPFCRRGDDQRVYCMRMLPTIGDRACRRAVAVLAAKAGTSLRARRRGSRRRWRWGRGSTFSRGASPTWPLRGSGPCP